MTCPPSAAFYLPSLHDALPIYRPSEEEVRMHVADEGVMLRFFRRLGCVPLRTIRPGHGASLHYAGTFPITASERELTCDRDRKSTRLNSSHEWISYAVICLKKK